VSSPATEYSPLHAHVCLIHIIASEVGPKLRDHLLDICNDIHPDCEPQHSVTLSIRSTKSILKTQEHLEQISVPHDIVDVEVLACSPSELYQIAQIIIRTHRVVSIQNFFDPKTTTSNISRQVHIYVEYSNSLRISRHLVCKIRLELMDCKRLTAQLALYKRIARSVSEDACAKEFAKIPEPMVLVDWLNEERHREIMMKVWTSRGMKQLQLPTASNRNSGTKLAVPDASFI
jgi:hypothetical protein